jgi:hypothetical protein
VSKALLRSAFFDDFKGGPKVLFWGDADGMSALARFLRETEAGSNVSSMGGVAEAVDGRKISVELAFDSEGMKLDGDDFVWRLERDQLIAFAEMIEILAESDSPGHQYLVGGDRSEIDVMVACNEYPAELTPAQPI